MLSWKKEKEKGAAMEHWSWVILVMRKEGVVGLEDRWPRETFEGFFDEPVLLLT